MKIALFSFSDVNNYGDKYFTVICRAQLATRLPEAEFTLFSPTGAEVDGHLYQAYEPTAINGKFDALILAGGEVVHADTELFRNIYKSQGIENKIPNPTDMVFRLPALEARYKAWFSLGITSSKATLESIQLLKVALPALNKVALRGVLAKDTLDALVGTNLATEVIPDLGWLIPQYNPGYKSLWVKLANSLQLDSSQPYFVFHALPSAISHENQLFEIANTLQKAVEKTGLKALLLPITRYAGDNELLKKIARFYPEHLAVLPADLDMYETTAVLLNCQFSITGSMHGAISCLAAGIPTGIIHIGEAKLTDVFGHQMRLSYLQNNWQKLEELLFKLWQEPRAPLQLYAQLMRQQLETAFDSLAEEIRQSQINSAKLPFAIEFPENNNEKPSFASDSGRAIEWWQLNNTLQRLEKQLKEKEQINIKPTLKQESAVVNLPAAPPRQLIKARSVSRLNKFTQNMGSYFTLKSPFPGVIQGVLDLPVNNIRTDGKIEVAGWAYSSSSEIDSVKVYLAEHLIGEANYGVERLDVGKVLPTKATPYCGYRETFSFDTSLIGAGSKILTVIITDEAGNISVRKCQVQVQERKAKELELISKPVKPFLAQSLTGFRIFVTDLGNNFMLDIAMIFQEGLRASGFEVEMALNCVPDTHLTPGIAQLIVAPHEFYPLFLEKQNNKVQLDAISQASFFLNVEQPGSQWFELVCHYARAVRGIWDISQLGVAAFQARNIEAQHLPLGYVPFLEADKLEKKIDILFMGTQSPRREIWLAEQADFLSNYNCNLKLVRLEQIKQAGTLGYNSGQIRNAQLSASKILINLHMAERPYFEWHRALLAISNHCLLITEPGKGFEPLVNGQHFIMVETKEIKNACRYYLENESLRQQITCNAYNFMRESLDSGELCAHQLAEYRRQPLKTPQSAQKVQVINEK